MRLPPRRTWPSTPPVRSRHASVPPHPPPSSSSQGSNNLSYSHEHWHRLLFVFFLSDRMPVCLPLSLCFCHQATIVCRLSGSLSVLPPSLSLFLCVSQMQSLSRPLCLSTSLCLCLSISFSSFIHHLIICEYLGEFWPGEGCQLVIGAAWLGRVRLHDFMIVYNKKIVYWMGFFSANFCDVIKIKIYL